MEKSTANEQTDAVIWQGPVGDSVGNSVDIDSDARKLQSTPFDRAAMWRMGKTQELRVRFPEMSSVNLASSILTTSCTAGLLYYIDVWLHHDSRMLLGGSTKVSHRSS